MEFHSFDLNYATEAFLLVPFVTVTHIPTVLPFWLQSSAISQTSQTNQTNKANKGK